MIIIRTMNHRKKLIAVALPLVVINKRRWRGRSFFRTDIDQQLQLQNSVVLTQGSCE